MRTEIVDELNRIRLKQSFMAEIARHLMAEGLSQDAREGACFIMRGIENDLAGIVEKLDSELVA